MTECRIEAHGVAYTIDADPAGLIGGRIHESGQPYEAPLLESIYERGYTGAAVDAGAHIGNHSLWLAAVCGLEVWAYEPLEHEALVENVARNGLEARIHTHPVALGAHDGVAKVVGKGKLDSRAAGGTVPLHTLDGYLLEECSVMKLDVEDMEPEVLRGARNTIRRCRPVIYAEARDEACHEAIAAVLEPWGYHMGERFGVKWTPVECWEPR